MKISVKLKVAVPAIAALSFLLTGCDSAEVKAEKRRLHLASLTCHSSKDGRDKEELQAIADACFKGGSYTKSKPRAW